MITYSTLSEVRLEIFGITDMWLCPKYLKIIARRIVQKEYSSFEEYILHNFLKPTLSIMWTLTI